MSSRNSAAAAGGLSIAEHVFLANIDPTLQRSVLHQVKRRPKVVALDTMNYWIERTPEELRETLRHTDILMINDAETRKLSNEHNLLRAARHIFKLGPKALVIKRGEHGAMMVHQNRTFQRAGVSARAGARPHRRGRHLRRRIHGLSGKRGPPERCGTAARDGLRLGDGKLHGGEIRPGAAAATEARGNPRPGPAFCQDDPVQALNAYVDAMEAALRPEQHCNCSAALALPGCVVYFNAGILSYAQTS